MCSSLLLNLYKTGKYVLLDVISCFAENESNVMLLVDREVEELISSFNFSGKGPFGKDRDFDPIFKPEGL